MLVSPCFPDPGEEKGQYTRLCSKENATLLSSLYLHPPRELRLLMRELVYSFDKQKLKNRCLRACELCYAKH